MGMKLYEESDIQNLANIIREKNGTSETYTISQMDNAVEGLNNFSGDYNDLTNKPTLGTASPKDVASSGDASATQVVMGNDSRLTDRRGSTWGQINGTLSNQTDLNNSINSLQGQIDTFTALTDGSTTGDAELTNIRVDSTGHTYPTAGDAVRAIDSQVNAMKTGFDGVTYSSPAAMVQGCDEVLQDQIDDVNDFISTYTGKNYLDPSTILQNKTSAGAMTIPGQITTYTTNNICTNPPLLLKGGKTYYVRCLYSSLMDIILWNKNGGGADVRPKEDSKKHNIVYNGETIIVYDDSFTLDDDKWICINSQMNGGTQTGIYPNIIMITDFDFGHDYVYYDYDCLEIFNTSLNNDIASINEKINNMIPTIVIPKNKCYMVTNDGLQKGINSPVSSLTVVESDIKKYGQTTYDATIPIANQETEYEIYFQLDSVTDLTNTYKGFWVYLDSDTANALSRATFYIGNDNQIFTHNNMYVSQWSFVGGWNFIGATNGAFGYTSTFDPHYTSYVGLKLKFAETTKIHHVIFDSISSGMECTPIYTLNFDGWKKSTWDIIAPYLKTKNVKFTLFLDDPENSDIGVDDLMSIGDYGGELQMYSGQPAASYLSDSYYTQYMKMRGVYNNHYDIGDKVSIVSLSGGANNSITDRVIHSLGLKLARKTKDGYMELVDGQTLYTLNASYGDSTATLDSLKTTVDRCIAYKKITSCMTHNVRYDGDSGGNYNMTEALLKGWIDYISTKANNGDIVCMTYSELREKCCFPPVGNLPIGTHALLYESDGTYHEYMNNGEHWVELKTTS